MEVILYIIISKHYKNLFFCPAKSFVFGAKAIAALYFSNSSFKAGAINANSFQSGFSPY
jgi:hypothetical protein